MPDEALAFFQRALVHGAAQETAWRQRLEAYRAGYPALADEYERVLAGDLPGGWEAAIPRFAPGEGPMATRKASGKVLTALASHLWNLVGGSADLNPSTNAVLAGRGDFQRPPSSRLSVEVESATQGAAGGEWGWGGQNVHFGVREHAMGAILNGIALHGGLIAYGATFLIFSDYMRPPMRLAALMDLGVKYVFTHDSIAVGEDGPTHQPVEHLASHAAMPRLVVIRPADANEVAWAWWVALAMRDRPVALVLSRQDLPIFDRAGLRLADAEGVVRGAYVLADAPGDPSSPPDLVLLGTGSEVALCLEAREQLAVRGIRARVVSMPSWELFDEQPVEYRAAVLGPAGVPRLAVEAGVCQGWSRYIGERGEVLGIQRFGASAPGREVLGRYGFTVENVVTRALALLSTPGKGAIA